MVAIVLSAIFGTILLILLLLAAFLWCRRRRSRFKTKAPAVETRRWHDSERFQWGPPQRTSGASRDISSELFETSKTVPMSIWDSPESWDFSTIAPSDSISRVVSLKRTQGRWERGQLAERHSLGNLQSEESTREGRRIHIPAGRSKLDRNSRNNLANEGSDVGTSVVEETSWVHAGGPALIPQVRASTAGAR
ncbi:hypothetical protein J3R30DRAFT_1521933 [Lentinula aciculospora]|uniref:Uncharacterized protein n=1 Tax=Lentinula aciculospora TaxID=153920 RepID=A0A9W8ZY67_9AGAR|nr:hypothetical protein J3R30DRAFT_1521933 [Lentinula aciculospora]